LLRLRLGRTLRRRVYAESEVKLSRCAQISPIAP